MADQPDACTGIAASWCPNHGECTCGRDPDGNRWGLDGHNCPLHGEHSDHCERADDAVPVYDTDAREP